MSIREIFVLASALVLTAPAAIAQDTPPDTLQLVVIDREFCSDPANAEIPQCAEFLERSATNVAPLVAGAVGLLGAAALAGGGSSSTTTTTTTTTTN